MREIGTTNIGLHITNSQVKKTVYNEGRLYVRDSFNVLTHY